MHLIKKNAHSVSLRIPIYRMKLYVLDIKKPATCLKDKRIDLSQIDHDVVEAEADCQIVSHKSSAKGVLMRLERRYNESTLWHESIHAALMVLEIAGIDATDSDGETLIYLPEWIVKMVKEHFYRKKVDYHS